MSLLPAMVLYLTVGCGEWYLALRRTLACARGEKAVLVSIVFIENLLGLWVLSNFIRTNNWLLALSYSTGAAAGALIMTLYSPEKPPESGSPPAAQLPRSVRTSVRSFVPALYEHATRTRRPHRQPFLRRALRRVEHSGFN
ncbi:MAG: hypothetical protein JW955_00785 [Sedimentisphaerales bacterium]|nr:hypothetical protein [Sedimentisphaerales bacterium]